MDLMQKIGGRKFIVALVAMGAGIFLELNGKGVSTNMVTLLIGLTGAFHASNYFTTAKHFDTKAAGKDPGDTSDDLIRKVDDLCQMAKAANDVDSLKQITDLLTNLNNNITQVQVTSGQIGQAVVNMNKEVQQVKRAVSQPSF